MTICSLKEVDENSERNYSKEHAICILYVFTNDDTAPKFFAARRRRLHYLMPPSMTQKGSLTA